jgi:ubiquinone/menaquinone biosynthesis C-methylase UbiE
MTDDRTVWEKVYQQRGQLWSGAVPQVPERLHHARVLEMGCGNGKIFAALLQNCCDAIALDFSKTALKTAQTYIRDSTSGNCILADARFLPFSPASFDAIFAWHILGHMTTPDRFHVASVAGRLLKPGGTLFFSEFSSEDFRYNVGNPVEESTFLRGNGIHTHYFTEHETRSLFSGLSCISLRTQRWDLKIRGHNFIRSEIQAEFSNNRVPK